MPEILDRCVEELLADPDFVPQGDRTKEESAVAVCRTSLNLAQDGSEDRIELNVHEDEMRRRVAETRKGLAQVQTGPILVRDFAIACTGRNFKNGDLEFDLTEKDLDHLVANFKALKRRVPVLLQPTHLFGESRSAIPGDGWVVDLERRGQNLVARMQIHGRAAEHFLTGGFHEGSFSIGTIFAKDVHGKDMGEALDHVLITNIPFIPDLRISAARPGAEVVHIVATRKETDMDPNKDKTLTPAPAGDVPALQAQLRDKDQEIVSLKAQLINANTQLENLQNGGELVQLKAGQEALQRRDRAREIRELCESGLKRGTLSPAACTGYAGKGLSDYEGTLSWFKASPSFQDNLEILKYAVNHNTPRVLVGKEYVTGTPLDKGELTLTRGDEDELKRLGHDPARITAIRPGMNYDQWKATKEAQAKA